MIIIMSKKEFNPVGAVLITAGIAAVITLIFELFIMPLLP